MENIRVGSFVSSEIKVNHSSINYKIERLYDACYKMFWIDPFIGILLTNVSKIVILFVVMSDMSHFDCCVTLLIYCFNCCITFQVSHVNCCGTCHISVVVSHFRSHVNFCGTCHGCLQMHISLLSVTHLLYIHIKISSKRNF